MHQNIMNKLGRTPVPPLIEKILKEEKNRKKPKLTLRQLFFLKKMKK